MQAAFCIIRFIFINESMYKGGTMKSYIDIFNLEGKVAVITGGATGLGFSMAQCLAGANATVVLVGRREEELEHACREIGERAHYIRCDITDFEGIPVLVDSIVHRFGGMDVLINNAGIQIKKPALCFEAEDLDRLFDVHLKAGYLLTKASVPHMKGGSVIFLSSETGFIGVTGVLGYSMAKSGTLGMMRSFASELSGTGIRFNAIVPGWTDTPMLRYSNADDPGRAQRIIGRTPMKKFGQPEDIGWAALYLASDASRFVTGTSLVVDGGAMIGF